MNKNYRINWQSLLWRSKNWRSWSPRSYKILLYHPSLLCNPNATKRLGISLGFTSTATTHTQHGFQKHSGKKNHPQMARNIWQSIPKSNPSILGLENLAASPAYIVITINQKLFPPGYPWTVQLIQQSVHSTLVFSEVFHRSDMWFLFIFLNLKWNFSTSMFRDKNERTFGTSMPIFKILLPA